MGTDSLYYIMDYSGHYYRTDKSDQLVAVAGEQDATVFTFAQANSRICVGKKASFYCMVPIEETEEDMSTEASVSNEMDDNSGALHVEEQEENNDDEYISPIKELTYDEVTEPIEKNVASYDLSEMDWQLAAMITMAVIRQNRSRQPTPPLLSPKSNSKK